MFKLAIVPIFATLVILFWVSRKRHIHHSNMTGQDPESIGDQDENKDELDGTKAAEVVATWNLSQSNVENDVSHLSPAAGGVIM